MTYEKTTKLTDDDGKTCNVINYRHYNKKRKSKQTGGVFDGEGQEQETILKHELEALAAVLHPSLKAFYDSPEGQAQIKEWRELRQTKKPQKSQTPK